MTYVQQLRLFILLGIATGLVVQMGLTWWYDGGDAPWRKDIQEEAT